MGEVAYYYKIAKMSDTNYISLKEIDFLPYLNSEGAIAENLEGAIGLYAIFNQDKTLEYVGYSRNIYLSLKQHLVKQPDKCYWLKIHTISRPSRTILEEIKQQWLREETNNINLSQEIQNQWTESIDTKPMMTEDEIKEYQQQDELGKIKLLKKVSRRVEETIKEKLTLRGVTIEIRFNPKLKEQGLLDLK